MSATATTPTPAKPVGAAASASARKRSATSPPLSPFVVNTPRFTIVASGFAGILLTLAGLFGVSLTGSALVTGVATPAIGWAFVFQLVVALCGVFPALLLRGHFRTGPVLCMLSSGACALATLPLMEPNIVFAVLGRGTNSPEVFGVSLLMIAAISAIPAAVLCLMAALGTFLRAPIATIPRFFIGLALLAAPGVAYLLVGVPKSPFGSGAAGAALTAVAATLAFALVLILIAVGVHLVARSIEIGIDAGSPERVSSPDPLSK
jgi:hypothetical protein